MTRSTLVLRNIAATLVTQIASWALTFIVTIYVPRYLGATGLGTLTLGGSFAGIFAVIGALGTSTVLITEIAKNRERMPDYFISSVALRVVLSILSFAVGWPICLALGYPPLVRTIIAISLAGNLVGQLGDLVYSVFRGLEDFPRQNGLFLVERTVTSVVSIGLVMLRAPLWMFAAGSLIGPCLSLTGAIFALKSHVGVVRRPRWATIVEMTRLAVPYLAVNIFSAIYGQSDALLLSKLSTIAAIGWYSLAKRLAGSTFVIPVALNASMLPTLTRVYQESVERYRLAVRRLFRLSVICAVPPSAVMLLAPGQILDILHYPISFRHSIPVLMLMGATVVLWFLTQATATALIACGRQAVFGKYTGIAAALCVPLCATCILLGNREAHNGALGAMAADALLEFVMLFGYIRALPGGLLGVEEIGAFARAVVAALPLILACYLVRGHTVVILIAIGLILYVPLCWVLGCIYPEDMQLIRQILRIPPRT